MRQNFFGYGSLVNANTHHTSHGSKKWVTQPATLSGWRRSWNNRTHVEGFGKVVSLTAYECENCEIDGLLANVPTPQDWDVLAVREKGYDRLQLEPTSFAHVLKSAPSDEFHIYQTQEQNRGAATEGHRILHSYIDAVMQGYLHVFGEDGVKRFIATTDGWDGEIFDDRAKPIYPRSVVLTNAERDLFDEMIRQ